MVHSRLDLHELLVETLGSRNVYFQPPENLKMNYPALVYSLSNARIDHADNHIYLRHKRYDLTVIDPDPDSEIADRVADLPFCSFDRMYKANDLNHFVFTIYY